MGSGVTLIQSSRSTSLLRRSFIPVRLISLSFPAASVTLITILPNSVRVVNCIGYVFKERPRPVRLEPSDYIPHLKRPINESALKSQGIKNPLSLLSTLTKTRTPITLADGTVLHPPAIGGPGRKIVILGDTFDASAIIPLAQNADMVVHECTNAFLPELDESQRRAGITIETVRETAKSHGHSTPEVAGAFAKSVNAKRLVMNHLSVKYPHVDEMEAEDESDGTRNKRACLREIERLASVAWGGGDARAAYDFMEVELPVRKS